MPAEAEGPGEDANATTTTRLLWISGLVMTAVILGLLWLLTQFVLPEPSQQAALNAADHPPATIAPSPPQEDAESGQDGQSGGNDQGQGTSPSPGQDGSGSQGQGGASDGTGSQDGSQGRPGAPGDPTQGKGPQPGSTEGNGSGSDSGGSQGQEGSGGQDSSGGQGGSQGSDSQGGTQRPPASPTRPSRPQGPPTPGGGGGQAAPTTRDPEHLKETATFDTRVFMQLTLLPLGAEDSGGHVTRPAEGRVEQVNTVTLKNGKTIKVTAFRGTGTRALIEQHRGSAKLETPVVYGEILTRDTNPQVVGQMGADGELIGVLIESDERIPVADLESLANGMRFDFD